MVAKTNRAFDRDAEEQQLIQEIRESALPLSDEIDLDPLMDRIGDTITTLRRAGIEGPLPADAVTASGSGLDPDITPAHAQLQIARVAAARSLPVETVAELVAANTETPAIGFFGEPRVNVLKLNFALDAIVAPGG